MKILNRKEFMSLPEGILFCKYSPCYLDELCIKGESWTSDFWVQYLNEIKCFDSNEHSEKLHKAENGESIDLDFHCQGRDGLFDEDQLFAVFERRDYQQLMERLKQCESTYKLF